MLKVTKQGHSFLKKPVSFKIVEDRDFEEEETIVQASTSFAVDPELFAMLKNLRKKLTDAGASQNIKAVYGFGYKFTEND